MKFLLQFIIVIALFPIVSGAQNIRITDAEQKPVNQAVVFLKDLETGKEQISITNPSGVIERKEDLRNLQIFVSHVSFENHIDTINSGVTDIEIRLKSKKVDLDEIVVTSEYTAKTTSESVHPVMVITRQQIENQSVANLENLLSQQLSMRVSQDAILGSGLTMNGLSGQNIKILVDGVPVIGRLDGHIDISQVNLNDVERIEIVNGPMAAAYGTDAAGGVINLITRQAVNQTYQSGINLYYESIGRYNADGFAGYAKGKSAVLVSGGRNFFDGWSQQDTGRWQEWKPKEQYFGNLKYRFTHKNLVLGYQASAFHEKISNKGIPKLSPYFAYAFDEYYKTLRITNQLNGSYILSRDWSLSGIASYAYYSRTKNSVRKDLVSLDEILIHGAEQQDTTLLHSIMGRLAVSRSKSDAILNYQAGIDINVDNAGGTRFKENVKQTGDYALFASAEYQVFKKLSLKPAVRFSYNTDFDAPVIPSIMIKYDVVKNLQARLSYGKGFRSPGIKERYLYFVDINHNIRGNENLRPEHSDNYFLAVTNQFNWRKTRHQTQVSGFYNDIRNLITLAQPDPSASLFTYINIGKFSTHGGTITHGVTWNQFVVNVGAGYTGRYNIYADSGDFKKYIYSPDFNASLQYLFSKINLTASVYFKYNGKLPGYKLNDDNTITQFSNDSYRFLDATLRKGFFKNTLFISGGVKNILNITNVKSFTPGAAHSSATEEQAIGTGRMAFGRLQYIIGK